MKKPIYAVFAGMLVLMALTAGCSQEAGSTSEASLLSSEGSVSSSQSSQSEDSDNSGISEDEHSEHEYAFEDEQHVDDYHTADEFTDNEEFNELFKKNPLNEEYDKECRELETITDMRQSAIKFAGLWQEQTEKAYQKLYDLLSDRPEEQKKLEQSQEAWKGSLDDTEASFRAEGDGGTNASLAADIAMMNYYKGRAAVLYEQIYVITGDFTLE